jgi:hypothetical protein
LLLAWHRLVNELSAPLHCAPADEATWMSAGLFPDLGGNAKFEASGITHVNGSFIIVFDSLQELGVTGPELAYKGEDNYLAGEPGIESEYEAICHRSRTGVAQVTSVWHRAFSGTALPTSRSHNEMGSHAQEVAMDDVPGH